MPSTELYAVGLTQNLLDLKCHRTDLSGHECNFQTEFAGELASLCFMPTMRSLLSAAALLSCSVLAAPPALPPHPRIILTDARVQEIQQMASSNSDAAVFLTQLVQHADWVVLQPVVPEPAPGPSGVLIQVRQVSTSVYASQIEGRLNSVWMDVRVRSGHA